MTGKTELVKALLSRLGDLEDIRRPWESNWQEIIDYVVPRRTPMDDSGTKGQLEYGNIYDGTSIGALNVWSRGMQGHLMSSNYKWVALVFEIAELMDLPGAREWLQFVERVLLTELRRSNFYKVIHEYFLDAGSFATTTMYVGDDAGRLNFRVLHPRECYIDTNDKGRVDTLFRKFSMKARQMVQRFDEDNLHSDVVKAAEKTPNTEYEVLHATYPREDTWPQSAAKEKKRVASVYVDITHTTELRISGYDEMPYLTWRVYENSDEVYGRGPSWDALSDIKGINEYAKTNIKAAQMSVDPPWWVPEEMKGSLRLVPRGLNFYKGAGSAVREIKALSTGQNYPIGIDREQQKREAIERHYMVDFFLMLASAQKELTATEVRERLEEKSVMLGPIISGLEHEMLDPFIDRAFAILTRAGKIPPPPESLAPYAGTAIRVDYVGPMAQAQQRFFKNRPYQNTLAEILPLVEIRPDIMDNFNWDEIVRDIAETNGVPANAILDEKIVQMIRKQRVMMAQQEAKMQQLERTAEIAPKLNEPVKPGSMLENVEEAQVAG